MLKSIITSLFILLVSVCTAQDGFVGKWKTIDDETGKPKSIVEIYKQGNQYFGKVDKLILEPGEDPNPICDECDEDDSRYKKRIIGMVILSGMTYDADEKAITNGEILDPENGEVYDCKMWLSDDGKLNVRGYVLFFFRTQQWLPVEN